MGRQGGEMAACDSGEKGALRAALCFLGTFVPSLQGTLKTRPAFYTSLREKPIMPTTPINSDAESAPLTMRLMRCQS